MEKKLRRKRLLVLLVMGVGLVFCCGGWLASVNSFVPGHPISCVWEGGKWGVWGFGNIGCNPRTQDGGMICMDQEQCEGTCVVPGLPESSMNEISIYVGTGICTTHRHNLGCIVIMKDGHAVQSCSD